MSGLAERLAALSPEKRKLLERRLAREGLEAPDRRAKGGRTIPRRAEGPGPWPLTYGQRRLWFIDRMNPGTPAYNIPFAGRLAGPLHAGLLAASLRRVVRRHAVLRSRFVERDGRPVQVVDSEPRVRLPVVDLGALPRTLRDAEARRLTDADPQLPFDLARGPVFRMTLLRLGVEGSPVAEAPLHDFLVTMPHIVTDAWSMAVLFRELPALYDGLRRGRDPALPEPPVQVADVALWERERLSGETGGGGLQAELDFWREHLRGAPAVVDLPTDRPRPPVQTFRGIRRSVQVPRETTRRLERLAEGEGATLFMALLATYAVVLSRWSGQDDLLICSPLATRGAPELQGLIGFFIDNAVLRVDVSGDPDFRRLLGRARDSALATFAHQSVPFEKVAEAAGAGGDLSRPPLSQVNFVLQNVHIPSPSFENLTLVHAQQTDTRSARFDLSLGLFEDDGGLDGWIEYNTDLFDATTIARFERDWLDLVRGVVDRPGLALSARGRLGRAARQQLLVEWNDTASSVPDRPVHELVARRVGRAPDAVALEAPGSGPRPEVMSYGELARRAAELARDLEALGAGPERGVAVTLERSPELVVALLAILRTGSFYVPLDAKLPPARRETLLRVVRPAAVVTRADGRLALQGLRGVGPGHGPAPAGSPPERRPVPSDALAYVLFTSGSTGAPRGVAVEHRAVTRLVEGLDRYAAAGPDEAFLGLAPVSFDASTFELWGCLARGARLVLHPPAPVSLEGLDEVLSRTRVTVLWLTAGLFHLVVDRRPEALEGLRVLLAGGDVLAPGAVSRVVRRLPRVRLIDGYGPTENTTFTTCHVVRRTSTAGASVPIGQPIPATRVQVVDRELHPVPLGVPGELLAGGAGLARGYLGRPAATAAAFVPDPCPGAPGVRVYRTGDRVRWRTDGALEFLGRIDRQVKVRGYRVEPAEVEAALEAHDGVRAAVVGLRDGRLVAWIETGGGEVREPEGPDPVALRVHLQGRLPEFSIPAAFVPVARLPLTANGKVDRERLPDPGPALVAASGEAAPSGPAERTLAAVWREVLGLERVGVHDRFFDLGGDSILAIRVVSRAAEAGLRLEPRDLFEQPTIAGLAAVVAEGTAPAPPASGPVTGPVPLGPAQRWLLSELAPPVPDHWNMALLFEVRDGYGPLRLDRLGRAARDLLAEHDMLRARFTGGGETWRQEVEAPGGPAPVATVDLGGLPPAKAERGLSRSLRELHGSLDLGRGRLFRLVRLELPGGQRPRERLLLLVHHLVADAVSLRVLVEDLVRRLGSPPGEAPAPLRRTAPYRDWVEALESWAEGPGAEPERLRWQGLLGAADGAGAAADPAAAEAPALRPAAGAEDLEGRAATVEAALPEDLTRRLLTEAPASLRARPDEVVLAGAVAALVAADRRRELWVEVEGHGRNLPGADPQRAGESGTAVRRGGLDLSRTVGWFTVLYPLRVLPERGEDPVGVLRAVKEALRSVPDGGVGYAALRWSGAGAAGSLGRVPPPALSFNYLGRIDEALGGAEGPLALAPEPPGPLRHPRSPRPCPLEVTAYVLGGRVRAVWTYGPERHPAARVEALAESAFERVRELLERGIGGAAEVLDPSDFPHADLDRASLERLAGRLGGD